MPWWLWVILGVLALAGETISMALFLLYVGAAAFVAALLALLNVAPAAQFGVFVALSILLIGLVRPRMLQALTGRVPHRSLTNEGALVGRTAAVTQTVTPDSGMIRVGNAEFWSARANPPAAQIAVGESVRIAYVDGLTAYVDPLTIIPAAPLASGLADTEPELAREER